MKRKNEKDCGCIMTPSYNPLAVFNYALQAWLVLTFTLAFSNDVTAAVLVFRNNKKLTSIDAGHVCKNALQASLACAFYSLIKLLKKKTLGISKISKNWNPICRIFSEKFFFELTSNYIRKEWAYQRFSPSNVAVFECFIHLEELPRSG